jgi:hypothetical protein
MDFNFLDTIPEILVKIFSYLDQDDMLAAIKVSSNWYQILNDRHVFIDKYSNIVSDHIWKKYSELVCDSFIKNLKLYRDLIEPEQTLYDYNIALQGPLMVNDSIHEQLTKTLTFPNDIEPTEFRDYIRSIKFEFSNHESYVKWLSILIRLYDIPWKFPVLVQDYASYKTQREQLTFKELSVRGHSLYWKIIQQMVLGENTPAVYKFVEIYRDDLNWGSEGIYRSIQADFINKYPYLWSSMNWAWICINVKDLSEFIINVIIEYNLCNINYVIINQRLTQNQLSKWHYIFNKLDKTGKDLLFLHHNYICQF